MKWTLLTLTLLFCGCAAVNKAEALIGKVSAQVDAIKPKVDLALATASEAKAKAEKTADEALATLAAKGAPVDGSASELVAWAAKNPVEAAGVPGALLTAIAALAVGYKRKKDALGVVAKGVEDAPDDAKALVKHAIAAAGGSDKTIRATIRAAKQS